MFKYVQTFYLDSAVVKDSSEASLSKIGLYFRGKPKAINNKSGIERPGVEVSIVPVVAGIPQVSEMQTIRPPEPTEHGARFSPRFEIARREWGEIIATTDATVETEFVFTNPIQLRTKTEYGILVKFDGNEDFILWTSKKGAPLVTDRNIKSPGVSNRYIGNLFSYLGTPNQNIDQLTPVSSSANNSATITTQSNLVQPTFSPDASYSLINWKPINSTDLKFKVYVARYSHSGFPVASNTTVQSDPEYQQRLNFLNSTITMLSDNVIRISSPSFPEEFILYNQARSTIDSVRNSERVAQPQPFWPPGAPTSLTVTVETANNRIRANSSYLQANGSTFNNSNGFNNIFKLNGIDTEYIVVDSGTKRNIRKIVAVLSNTEVVVDRALNFTNTTAKIYKAPVAEIAGISDTYENGSTQNFLILTNSNANSSVRFVNNSVQSANITAGGSGYNNSDYVTLTGYEDTTFVKGGYAAVANLVTNSTGGITTLVFSNTGSGFVNSSAVAVAISNSSNLPSSGAAATFSFQFGANLVAESNTISFQNCVVTNIEASRIKPEITVNNPLGTAFVVNHRSLFYSRANTSAFSGKDFLVYSDPSVTDIPVKIFKSHDTGHEEIFTSIVPSRSNQWVIPYANGSLANSSVIGEKYSNASVFLFDVSSNNDYTSTFIEPEIINSHYAKYVINNDYTDEHTNYGNAYAKHVTTKVSFNQDRSAEDILVYLTAYRPAGTDFKVYARIHNNKDPEAFDDKDWTLLEEVDGIGLFSSKVDTSDFIEITYNFQQSPATTVLSGTVAVSDAANTTITGANTLFLSQLAPNTLIKITQPLFSSNSFAICVVNSIASNTSLTIHNPVGDVGLVGTGLEIAKVTYPQQAFNNVLNDNIVRYFNSQQVAFDAYDTFQVKVVMLSNNETIVPKIDDIRTIGVTT